MHCKTRCLQLSQTIPIDIFAVADRICHSASGECANSLRPEQINSNLNHLLREHNVDDLLHAGVEESAAESIKHEGMMRVLLAELLGFFLDTIERQAINALLNAV
jgi:hypothetical protein